MKAYEVRGSNVHTLIIAFMSSNLPVPKLPTELLEKIAAFLKPDSDRATLINLCLVSEFSSAAQRILYQRVAFLRSIEKDRIGYKSYSGDGDEEDMFGWVSKTTRLPDFLTIASTPNHPMAAQIQEFSCALARDSSGWGWDLLDKALRQMVGLKCLRITIMGGANIPQDNLLAGYPFQLDRLCWLDYRRQPNFGVDIYETFLSSQPHLKYLDFATNLSWGINGPVTIQCPQLQTLVGDFHQVPHILPSVPSVTALCVYTFGEHKVNRRTLKAISSTFSNLRVLVFYPWFLRDADFEPMISCLSGSLEILQIVIRELGMVNDYARDAVEIFPFIPRLTKLRKFIWSCNPIFFVLHQQGLIFFEDQEEITSSWFQTMPNLTTVYFSLGHERNLYARWSPDKAEPEEVTSDDFRYETPFPDVVLDRRFSFDA